MFLLYLEDCLSLIPINSSSSLYPSVQVLTSHIFNNELFLPMLLIVVNETSRRAVVTLDVRVIELCEDILCEHLARHPFDHNSRYVKQRHGSV